MLAYLKYQTTCITYEVLRLLQIYNYNFDKFLSTLFLVFWETIFQRVFFDIKPYVRIWPLPYHRGSWLKQIYIYHKRWYFHASYSFCSGPMDFFRIFFKDFSLFILMYKFDLPSMPYPIPGNHHLKKTRIYTTCISTVLFILLHKLHILQNGF